MKKIKKLISKYNFQYNKLSLPLRASLWYMICSILQKGLSFLATPLFTRKMSLEEFGTISLYNSWLVFFTIIANLSLPVGVYNKAMIKYENERDAYTSCMMVFASCNTILIAIMYFVGESFWGKYVGLDKDIIIFMFLDIFFSTVMAFWSIRKRFEYKYKSVVIVTLLSSIISTALSLYLVLNSSENKAYYKIAGQVVTHVCIYFFLFFVLLYNGRKIYKKEYVKYSIKYNLPLIPHYLSQQVLIQADRIMISNLCGSAEVALYSLAYQLSMLMQIVIDAIHASLVPWTFEKLKHGNYNDIRQLADKIEIIIGMLSIAVSLIAPEIIYVLGGDKYFSAIYVIPPIAISILFITIYGFWGNIEFYYEKTSFVMVASVFAAVLNIGLNYLFIPIFGFVAAGYTTLGCYVMYAVLHYLFMLKICKEQKMCNPYNGRKIWVIASLISGGSFLVSFLYPYRMARYIVLTFVMIGTVFGIIRMWVVNDFFERKSL